MAWCLIEKPKTMRATRALAEEYAGMDETPQERPLRESRLQAYRKMVNEGTFRPVTWAKCHCIETDATYRVNGHHTSVLISGMEPFPEFYVTLESYRADTLADVARLYETFDNRLSMRTTTDINNAFASTIPEYNDLPRSMFSTIVSGVGFAMWEEGYWRKSVAERAEILVDEVEFTVWVCGMICGEGYRNARHLDRAPVIAAMYMTWKKSHRDATTFWSAVRDETGLRPSLPDRVLAKYLITTNVDSRGKITKSTTKADRRTFYVKCLHAWNAWRRSQPTDLKYHADAKIPSVV
jgi:hypothetical protein